MRVDLVKFKDIHKGETAVVLGNGPSLKLSDIQKLRQYKFFGSNQIYRLPFIPDYYSIVDKEMLDACLPLPMQVTSNSTMFLRAEAKVERNNPIYPIVGAGFSRNIDNFVIMGGTVTYVLIQLAYYMGFTTLLLLGVDHHYPKAETVTPGDFFVAGESDPDHFQPSDGEPYFRAGIRYNAPELERTTVTYNWAKEFFKVEGRKIYNLTPNSKLDVFEKMSVDQWLTR
jgi:hypothetical protein